MTALDTMKSALQCSKTEAASLRIRVRQLEEKLVEAAAVSDLEVTALRQGSEFLVAENARLVAAVAALKKQLAWAMKLHGDIAKEHEVTGRSDHVRALECDPAAEWYPCPCAICRLVRGGPAEDAPRGAK